MKSRPWRRSWGKKASRGRESESSTPNALLLGLPEGSFWIGCCPVKRSPRFGKQVYVIRHARERMAQRGITEDELDDLLENGDVRYKDPERLWIAKEFLGRMII